jgi:hypothetical protein
MNSTRALAIALTLTLLACSKDEPGPAAAASASASAAPPPSASAASTASAPAPSATASAAPPVDCPKGSSGDGTFAKPCDAKGTARMMEAAWTGKTDDKGPHFRITNKSSSVVLYGKVAVYFYDKAKKQLDVKDSSGKTRPYQSCSGNIFQGVLNPGEKAVLMFSCTPKDIAPDGTVSIEAEVPVVGFADSSGKQVAYYWRNNDLAPDARPLGGIKK